jgi:hypothetical protein
MLVSKKMEKPIGTPISKISFHFEKEILYIFLNT